MFQRRLKKSAAKNQSTKCSQQVRNIPLERYRLPNDGRKWKQATRSRSEFLVRLSTYANGDGTFVRDGRNYSPSLETLSKHVGHGSYYKLTDDLRAAGLLSWARVNHYDRRIYTIHLTEQVQDSTENRSKIDAETGPRFTESGPAFEKTGPTFDENSQKQVQHSQITGPATDSIRLFPSKERAVQPTVQPSMDGRTAGGKSIFGSGPNAPEADKDEPSLTEELMLDHLHKNHAKLWDVLDVQTTGLYESLGLPRVPNLTGSKKLFDAVRKHGITQVDQLPILCTAYEIFFNYKYIASFDAVSRAEEKVNVDAMVRVPEPIHCPFAVFRKELGAWLDEARKQLEEVGAGVQS